MGAGSQRAGKRDPLNLPLPHLCTVSPGGGGGTGCLSPLPLHPRRWLRLQGTLKEHHEALQLALEVAAFLQQADTLLKAIHAKVPAPEPGSARCMARSWAEAAPRAGAAVVPAPSAWGSGDGLGDGA